MSSHASLINIESKIASDIKNHPGDLKEVFKELRDLRSKDGSAQIFAEDLATINKDLQDKNILPNLKIIEDPGSDQGFNIQQLIRDWQKTDSSGGTGGGSSGGGSRSAGGSDTSSGGASVSNDSTSAAPEASPADPNLPSDVPSGSLAESIIRAGENVGGKEGTVGMCLKGVQDSLDSIGIKMPRRNWASQMAPDFAADTTHFQEVNSNEPPHPGDIIVHGGTAKNPAGHIAIVLPNGKESSDHVQGLIN